MAKGNFAACLAKTLAYEGGYSDNPKDPGGATMKGITLASFRRHHPGATKAQLKAIPQAEVEAIYRSDYWRPVRGDDVQAGVDMSLFDYGVHSGPAQSVRDAQRVVGAKADGVLGSAETLPAIRRMPPAEFIKAHCARRLGLLKSLAIWKTFGKGLANRVAAVEAAAMAMVLTKPELEREANNAKATANAQAGGAATIGAGGAAGTITDHGTTLPIGLVIAAVVIVVVILIIRTAINRKRADALAAAAEEA